MAQVPHVPDVPEVIRVDGDVDYFRDYMLLFILVAAIGVFGGMGYFMYKWWTTPLNCDANCKCWRCDAEGKKVPDIMAKFACEAGKAGGSAMTFVTDVIGFFNKVFALPSWVKALGAAGLLVLLGLVLGRKKGLEFIQRRYGETGRLQRSFDEKIENMEKQKKWFEDAAAKEKDSTVKKSLEESAARMGDMVDSLKKTQLDMLSVNDAQSALKFANRAKIAEAEYAKAYLNLDRAQQKASDLAMVYKQYEGDTTERADAAREKAVDDYETEVEDAAKAVERAEKALAADAK